MESIIGELTPAERASLENRAGSGENARHRQRAERHLTHILRSRGILSGSGGDMLAYVLRRLLFGAAVLAGTSIITFVIAFVVPADPSDHRRGKADPQTFDYDPAPSSGSISRSTSNTPATSTARCMATWAAPISCART